ncbi:hypothetical protein ACFPMF_25005 [Larkinella bovis]|uniref:Uncharacterized protein n=1 Tax=Larkinella bovis TaxID=683041 RepID=A0ABW0IJB4_9BACT
MDQLALKLQKIQEYAIRTTGGYCLSNFHRSLTIDGSKLFRLHFKRDGLVKPTAFDIAIHFAKGFVVDYKDRDQDVIRLHFDDFEAVVAYLTAK